MRRYIHLITALLVFTVMAGCRGPKYYIKEGSKYEKSRNYEQAVAHYAEAYSMDPNNREAKKGFKRTGQKLLDQLLNDVQASYEAGNYKDAVEQYKKTEKYYNNVKDRGVELDFPEDGKTLYTSAATSYCKGLYFDAANSISTGDYGKARANILEIKKYAPDYTNLDILEKSLEADPIYSEALNYYAKNKKVMAYQNFKQVNIIYPGYRETNKFLTELSNLPKQKVAIFPVENKSREMTLDRLIYRSLEKKLFAAQNDFFSIADETSVQNELLKANKNSQPPFDDISVVNISRVLGSTYAVLIQVQDYTEEVLANTENFQVAYLRERVTYWDPYYGQTTNWQWRETKYKEIEEGSKYSVYVKVRVFDTQTGTLVYNDVVTKSIINKLKYAKFDGDYNDLYPTTGYITQTEQNKWRSRFTADQDRKSKNELLDIIVDAVTTDVTDLVLMKAGI